MDKRIANVKGYLVYIAITIGFIYIGGYLIENTFNYLSNQFPFQFRTMIIRDCMLFLYAILLGAILGLEHILNEKGKIGRWKLNVARLLILGLPMLILSLMFLIYFTGFARDLKIFNIFYSSKNFDGYSTIFRLILGYIIITSFYKSSQEEQG